MRQAQDGTFLPLHSETVAVGAIVANATLDVNCTADANFIGTAASSPLLAMYGGAPGANLTLVGAWISNAATGVITLRFGAGTGGYAGGNQAVFVQKMSNS